MEILICAATEPELCGLAGGVVTGVGVPATFAALFPLVAARRPSRILNIGIAGAYPGSGLEIGDIVTGTSEVFGDIGFELPDAPGFRPIADSPFGAFYADPIPLDFTDARSKTGRGCTVNACTGTEATGRLRRERFRADFETMEGAAVAQIGRDAGVPVVEIRAISNIASTRDMRPENIALALRRLKAFLQP